MRKLRRVHRLSRSRGDGLSNLYLGALAVLAFSFTLPATLVADKTFGYITVGLGRAVLVAPIAVIVLKIHREPLFVPKLLPRLAVVGLGVVVGFPLLTAIALQHVTSAHAAVVAGLIPAATAGMAVFFANERPSMRYWIAITFGVVAVLVFGVDQGAGSLRLSDLVVLLAVIMAGLGYAQGGVLAREYGGWKVISWALVISFPILMPITVISAVFHPYAHIDLPSLFSMSYVSFVSMYLAFFAWYRALARGGVARIGGIQLMQPFFTLIWSALLLDEKLDIISIATAGVVGVAVGIARSAPIYDWNKQEEMGGGFEVDLEP